MKRPTALQILTHLAGWLPLAWLLFDALTGRLSVNPIQDVEQRSGRWAVTFLVLSLACTPLAALGWKEWTQRRRALGLYGFLYASVHVLTFFGLDYGWDFSLSLPEVIAKRYTLVGAAAFLLLIPLAATSFQFAMKSLGRNWKRLHRLAYLAAPLAVLHFAWARKGDIFSLQGNILQPLLYGLIVAVLLALRLPPIRRAIAHLREYLAGRIRSRHFRPQMGCYNRPHGKNETGYPRKEDAQDRSAGHGA